MDILYYMMYSNDPERTALDLFLVGKPNDQWKFIFIVTCIFAAHDFDVHDA